MEFPDVAAFLEATAQFRAEHPVLTNVISTVAGAVLNGRRYESDNWWAMKDENGIIGVCMRTSPYNVVLSPMPQAAAARLGHHLRLRLPDLPGVSAPRDVGIAFLDCYLGDHRGTAQVRMHDFLRVLESHVPAPPVPGQPRRTRESDRALLTTWMQQFAADAGVHAFGVEAAVEGLLARGHFWDVDGVPVSICGHTDAVGNEHCRVIRVGPVFTPQQYRRRGYAAVITSHVLTLVQSQADIVMLYADASNATSNGVYERLGMPTVEEIFEWEINYADSHGG